MKNKLTAIMPDGEVATINTAKNYTHCAVVNYDDGDGWAWYWCGSRELAEKRLTTERNTLAKNPMFAERNLQFDIVEVQS